MFRITLLTHDTFLTSPMPIDRQTAADRFLEIEVKSDFLRRLTAARPVQAISELNGSTQNERSKRFAITSLLEGHNKWWTLMFERPHREAFPLLPFRSRCIRVVEPGGRDLDNY